MPHPVDIAVGAEIARRRIALGLNQSDLGRALGVTFQQVQKYEKGTNRVSASKLSMAAATLKCAVGDFFPASDAEPSSPPAFWTIKGAVALAAAFEALSPESRRALVNVAAAMIPEPEHSGDEEVNSSRPLDDAVMDRLMGGHAS